MALPSALHSQPSLVRSEAVETRCWQLPPGRVLSFQADKTMVLQVAQGRVWATLDGPHTGAANDLGDVVLQSGERFTLEPGQCILVESWSKSSGTVGARLVWSRVPREDVARSVFGTWLAQALGLLLPRGGRTARLGRLFGVFGYQSGLQCHAGPGCHGVG